VANSEACCVLLVATWLAGAVGCAPRGDHAADAGPLLVGPVHAPRLVLPERMRERLERGVPGFRVATLEDFHPEVRAFLASPGYAWSRTQAPFAVIGDFDGDERYDIAVLQCSDDSSRFVVVLDTEPVPRVVEVGRGARIPGEWHGLSDYLSYVPSGEMTWPDFEADTPDSIVWLEHAAFERSIFGKAALTYVYEQGEFRTYATGD